MLFLTVAYVVGFQGSFPTNEGLAFWYQTLRKPDWAAPAWLFVPAWTILYGLVAAAGWIVWSAPASRVRSAGLTLYGLQLGLVALWPWLFFKWHLRAASAVELTVLVIVVAATAWTFKRVRFGAGWLLVPYLAWLMYLLAVNSAIWKLNP